MRRRSSSASDGGEELHSAPIRWQVQGDAVRLRTFESETDHPFSDGALVTLLHPGTACVTAQLKEEGASSPEKIAEFVHGYAISVSTDGVHFDRCAEGVIRVYGGEEILPFPECTARYVRFEVLSTAGWASERKEFADACPCIGELTVFRKK